MSYQKELLQHQAKGTELDERTAELHCKQGNSGITDLAVIIDEMKQCKICKEHNTKGKCLCTCGSLLQELSTEKTNTLKDTTAQVMIHFSGLH